MNPNPRCPRCDRRTWGYTQYCVSCGLEARDILDRERPVTRCEPDEVQPALFEMPRERSGAVNTMNPREVQQWEASYQ